MKSNPFLLRCLHYIWVIKRKPWYGWIKHEPMKIIMFSKINCHHITATVCEIIYLKMDKLYGKRRVSTLICQSAIRHKLWGDLMKWVLMENVRSRTEFPCMITSSEICLEVCMCCALLLTMHWQWTLATER